MAIQYGPTYGGLAPATSASTTAVGSFVPSGQIQYGPVYGSFIPSSPPPSSDVLTIGAVGKAFTGIAPSGIQQLADVVAVGSGFLNVIVTRTFEPGLEPVFAQAITNLPGLTQTHDGASDMTGISTAALDVDVQQTFGLLSATGVSTAVVAARAQLQPTLVSTATANGTISIRHEMHVGVDMVGQAFTNANERQIAQLFLDPIEGNAFTIAAENLDIKLIPFEQEANAFSTMGADLIKVVVNPPLASQLIDVSDNTLFQFTIAGTLLDFTASCQWQLDNLNVTYDGKSLSFTEIPTPLVGGIGFPGFGLEEDVTLDVDWDDDGNLERIFTGRVKTRNSRGENNNEGFTYEAVGYQQLANEITAVSTDGRPRIEFTVGTTVTSVTSLGTEISTTFSKTVAEAVQDVFDFAATRLNTLGIPATIGVQGLGQFVSDLPESVVLENLSFTAAINRLVAYERGFKVFWDDPSQTWHFINILDAPTAVINIASVNLENAIFDVSTEDRYTAVRLFARNESIIDENIATKSETITIGNATGILKRTTVTLSEGWSPEFEAKWSLFNGQAIAFDDFENQGFFNVYRRFTMPATVIAPMPGTPVNAYAKYKLWTGGPTRVRRLHGRANFQRRTFFARFPAISRGNPHIEGDVVPPEEVQLVYWPVQFTVSLPTSTTSEGTPTAFVNTLFDSTEFLDEIRVPETGYDGDAFTIFNLERELVEIVDRTEVTSLNAQRILDTHKDIQVTGTFPIGGDPIRQLINLGVRARLQHPTMATGIQSLRPTITDYTYNFGKRGLTNLTVSTDITGLLSTR